MYLRRHVFAPSENPNGIPSQSPRVARNEPPWENVGTNHNPNGVVANIARMEGNEMATTALRLGMLVER